jgi:hypothetical protein
MYRILAYGMEARKKRRARAYVRATCCTSSHPTPRGTFFSPLKLVSPGVVDGREWYLDAEEPVHAAPRDGQVIVGVARV